MANILRVYTASQLYTMYRNKILSDNVGLTDFNEGSKIRSLLESNSEIVSTIAMDFKQSLYKAIPIALYEGFNFEKKAATKSTGFLRPYRKPAFYITYTGSGTAAKITSTSALISATVTGAGDDFSLDYITYTTIEDVVDAIDLLANWSATLVQNGDADSDKIYQYTDKEVVGSTNYLNATGLDIMENTAIEISVITGFTASVDNITFLTTADGTISAGESGATIASECSTTGVVGNIAASGIDTLDGSGYLVSAIDGIEHVINDSAFSGGSAAETDAERATRFAITVSALNAGTKSGIIAALSAIDGVRTVGMRVAYPYRGNNTIIIDDGSGSGTLDATIEAEAEKILYGDASDFENYPGKNAEGIGYIITVPTIQAVDVSVIVTRLETINISDTELQTDVQTAIEQYINTRGLGYDVLTSEIIRVSKNSNAAVYDVSVTTPSSNVTITEEEFAKTGSGTGASVTVTVTTTNP